MKIVINRCYGGYGLSKEAVMRYAELAGLTLYPEDFTWGNHFYTIPVAEYKKLHDEAVESKDWSAVSGKYFSDNDIERTDPLLIQVVEELGEGSWGKYSELKVVNIPDHVEWQLKEYDGMESIAEVHQTWS